MLEVFSKTNAEILARFLMLRATEKDPYRALVAAIYKIEPKDVKAHDRDRMKCQLFGFIYGRFGRLSSKESNLKTTGEKEDE